LFCSTWNGSHLARKFDRDHNHQDPDPDAVREHVSALMADGLERLGRPVDAPIRERLVDLVYLVASWAPRMNLTGHKTPDAIARHLVLDAVALACRLPDFGELADLGSGAGFPGLPVAILYPDRNVVTVEARSRRVFFQRHVVRELGLTNVEILEGRIEEVPHRELDCVVAQALAPPAKALDYMMAWSRQGGTLAIPGTVESLDFEVPDDLEVAHYRVEDYLAPLGAPSNRRLWLGRKESGAR